MWHGRGKQNAEIRKTEMQIVRCRRRGFDWIPAFPLRQGFGGQVVGMAGSMLFDPEHNLEERFIKEHFTY